MSLYLHKVGIEHNFSIIVIDIVILSSYVIDFNGTEYSYCPEALCYDSISRDFCISVLYYPLFKYLSGNERILRHCPYGLAFSSEEL